VQYVDLRKVKPIRINNPMLLSDTACVNDPFGVLQEAYSFPFICQNDNMISPLHILLHPSCLVRCYTFCFRKIRS
jgi:hypothetical protein